MKGDKLAQISFALADAQPGSLHLLGEISRNKAQQEETCGVHEDVKKIGAAVRCLSGVGDELKRRDPPEVLKVEKKSVNQSACGSGEQASLPVKQQG